MGRIATVNTFRDYCNKILGTNYSWNSNQFININWLCTKVRQIYTDIHTGINPSKHRRFLSPSFSNNNSNIVVDENLVVKVVNYLNRLRGVCNCDCACTYGNPTNNCCNDCSLGDCDCCTADCVDKCACDCACDCNCDCTKQTACECNCECDCDCSNVGFNCNCTVSGSQCTVCTAGDCYRDCCQNCDCNCDCACEWW